MPAELLFPARTDFRAWLAENAEASGGVWLVFGKTKAVLTLTANEALEEALCFGWIDGQMKSIDEKTYRKYFAQRRKKSEWSNKNIALVDQLEAAGRMTDFGRAKIEEAKREGHFKPRQRTEITEEHVRQFTERVKGFEPAYTNLMAMPPSVKRAYAGYSLDTKSEEAGARRLEKIVDRLNNNLKPM